MQAIWPAELVWMDALSATLEACAPFGPAGLAAPGLGASTNTEPVHGGRVEHRTFATSEGRRQVRIFVPDERPRGLVLMLHGCRQAADDFARATRFDRIAARHRLVAAYPNQARTQNPLGCWQWFSPRNQKRGSGEPAILADLTRALIEAHGLDGDVVFAAGLSAGAAMAATVGTLYPELFAAVGLHSGLPFGAARDVPGAFAAMAGNGGGAPIPLRRPAIVFHGTADQTVHAVNAFQVMRSLAPVPTSRPRYRLTAGSERGRRFSRWILSCSGDADQSELWMVEKAGHAWFGGNGQAAHADPMGPDASAEMVRFFLARAAAQRRLRASPPSSGLRQAA